MAITAEDITKERELTRLVWNKSYLFDNSRPDVGPQVKRGELESMVPVPADEFQRHRHPFLDGEFTRFIFKNRS